MLLLQSYTLPVECLVSSRFNSTLSNQYADVLAAGSYRLWSAPELLLCELNYSEKVLCSEYGVKVAHEDDFQFFLIARRN
jgi:hypothetical protein